MLLSRHHKQRVETQGLKTYLVKCERVPQEGAMKPHEEMYLWKGIPLIASSRNSHNSPLKNGRRYAVTRVTDEEVYVKPEASNVEEVELTYLQAAQYLRLACARTAASIRGITLRDQRLFLLDVRSPSTDHRRIYVCTSRLAKGDYLHVSTREQQDMLLRRR